MPRLFPIALFLAVAAVSTAAVFPPEPLHGVTQGTDAATVRALVEPHAASVRYWAGDDPTLPTSRAAQASLVCRGLELAGGGRLESASFVFSDGRLVLVQALGGAVAALRPHAGDQSVELGSFLAFPATMTVLDREADAAWIMAPESLHPHLFLWTDPHLVAAERREFDSSVRLPAAIPFGAALAEARDVLTAVSRAVDGEEIAPPWLPTGPERQVQLNVYGLEFGGFPRKAEYVFGDDRLELVWVLTGEGEEDRLRASLREAYGDPVFVSETFEAFDGWRVALRKDKPEVLFVSARLAPVFEQQYGD